MPIIKAGGAIRKVVKIIFVVSVKAIVVIKSDERNIK